jgi:HEAT repeat protein
VQAFLAADTLRRMGSDQARPVAACLSRKEPEARRRSAELLADLGHAGDFEDQLQAALAARVDTDTAWIVRAQAVRTLAARGLRHTDRDVARPALMRALADDDRAVACEAAEGLVALGDPKVVPALINFLERGVRENDLRKLGVAQDSLRALTGVSRQMDVAGWRKWWSENRASLMKDGRSASTGRGEEPRG